MDLWITAISLWISLCIPHGKPKNGFPQGPHSLTHNFIHVAVIHKLHIFGYYYIQSNKIFIIYSYLSSPLIFQSFLHCYNVLTASHNEASNSQHPWYHSSFSASPVTRSPIVRLAFSLITQSVIPII